jgi:hypothetical protein
VDAEDRLIESKGISTLAEGLGSIVALVAPPGGDLYYVDLAGAIYRCDSQVYRSAEFSQKIR